MRKFWLGISGVFLAACQPQDPLSAFGTLERDRILITAPVSEVIQSQNAAEGVVVTAGQPLLQLDATAQRLKVAKAQAEVQRAQAAFALLQQGSRSEQIASARARSRQAALRLQDSERSAL